MKNSPNKNHVNCRSVNNQITVTEPNSERNDAMSYYTNTERAHHNYLDYTFLSHRAKIHSKQTKDPKNIREYNHDLEKTLELNLEILQNSIPYGYDAEQNNTLKVIIELIRQKNTKRVTNKYEIKAKKSTLVNLKQGYEDLKTKIESTNEIYDNKVADEQILIERKTQYIKELKKRFKEIEKHLQYLALNGKFKRRPVRFTPIAFDINKYIKGNTEHKKNSQMLRKRITKIAEQISDLKKENILYREETVLYRNKTSNMNLIRVVEFYRRLIRSLQTKIKILKNSFENMTQTLHYLNLGDSK